jgi:hypothetical protein
MPEIEENNQNLQQDIKARSGAAAMTTASIFRHIFLE